MFQFIRPSGVACAIGAALLAGCQTYTPAPLEPAAALDAFAARDPGGAPVTALADALRAADPSRPPFDLSDGVSRDEAELIALVWNPELRRQRADHAVAAEIAAHAGQWEDPEFSIDVLRATSGVPSPWIIAPSLAFTIPISGRLDIERAHASAATAEALARLAAAEWETRCRVREAFAAWTAARWTRREIEHAIDVIEPLVTATARQADAGELTRPEATLFAIEAQHLTLAAQRAALAEAAADATLRGWLGITPDAPLDFDASFAAVGAETAPIDAAQLPDHPALLERRRAYDVAERALELEIRRQWPDLTIGPAFEREDGQSKIGVIAGLPIPLFNANRGGIARARVERDRARIAYETTLEETLLQLRAAEQQRDGAIAARDVMVRTIAPIVDRQVADARRLLAMGETTGLVLLESLSRAHAARLELIELERAVDDAHTAVARAAGPALRNPTTEEPS